MYTVHINADLDICIYIYDKRMCLCCIFEPLHLVVKQLSSSNCQISLLCNTQRLCELKHAHLQADRLQMCEHVTPLSLLL